jgi:hypothetical protein
MDLYKIDNCNDFFKKNPIIVKKYGNYHKVNNIIYNNELYRNILNDFGKKLTKIKTNNYYPKFQYKIPVLYKENGYKIQLGSVDSYLLLKSSPFVDIVKNYTYLTDSPQEILDKNYELNMNNMNYSQRNLYHIKKNIYLKNYDKLFNELNKNPIIISETYYDFLKIRDKEFVKYLRKYYFPRLIEENMDISNKLIFNINNIENRIKDTLNTIFCESPFFLKLFHKYEMEISGSFVLNHLIHYSDNQKYFKYDDLDIYVNNKFIDGVKYEINNYYGYKYIKNHKNKIQVGYHNQSIKQMINLYDYSTHIQLMFVDDKPFNFIRKNFDFDSCMNSYNLTYNQIKIHHKNPLQIHKMNISQLYQSKIFDLKDSYSNYRAAKTLQRCHKYIKRGFIIENLNEFLFKLENSF